MNNHTKNGETQDGQYRANPLDVAWLAGIIDGEGSINARQIKNRRGEYVHVACRLQVCNSHVPLMNRVATIVEQLCFARHSIRDMRMTYRKEFRNRIYVIEVAKQAYLTRVLDAVLPHLTAKHDEAQAALNFLRSRAQTRHHGEGYTKEEWSLPDVLRSLRTVDRIRITEGVQTERVAPEAA